ncbi:MAG: hypothetical protein SGILL_001129 [Bacillariaceae sp.]
MTNNNDYIDFFVDYDTDDAAFQQEDASGVGGGNLLSPRDSSDDDDDNDDDDCDVIFEDDNDDDTDDGPVQDVENGNTPNQPENDATQEQVENGNAQNQEENDARSSDDDSFFDDNDDEEMIVAKAHPSKVFDDDCDVPRTSVTSLDLDSDDDILDFSVDYVEGHEYQIQDWESHRGVNNSHVSSSQQLQQQQLYSVGNTKKDGYYVDSDEEELELDNRPGCLLIFTMCMLLCELAAGIIAVMYNEPLVECCGDSFVSSSDSTTNRWNQAMFGISIGYLVWVIVDIPIIALSREPVFLFNPLIGFLLSLHMFYVTNTTFAYVIFGLESVAMIGQSYVLIRMRRTAEMCLHCIFNFTMCGIVVYALIELSRQGGYCIVGGQLEGVFTDSTCNTGCEDEASCNICDGNATSCFIQFPAYTTEFE